MEEEDGEELEKLLERLFEQNNKFRLQIVSILQSKAGVNEASQHFSSNSMAFSAFLIGALRLSSLSLVARRS